MDRISRCSQAAGFGLYFMPDQFVPTSSHCTVEINRWCCFCCDADAILLCGTERTSQFTGRSRSPNHALKCWLLLFPAGGAVHLRGANSVLEPAFPHLQLVLPIGCHSPLSSLAHGSKTPWTFFAKQVSHVLIAQCKHSLTLTLPCTKTSQSPVSDPLLGETLCRVAHH